MAKRRRKITMRALRDNIGMIRQLFFALSVFSTFAVSLCAQTGNGPTVGGEKPSVLPGQGTFDPKAIPPKPPPPVALPKGPAIGQPPSNGQAAPMPNLQSPGSGAAAAPNMGGPGSMPPGAPSMGNPGLMPPGAPSMGGPGSMPPGAPNMGAPNGMPPGAPSMGNPGLMPNAPNMGNPGLMP